MAKGELRGQPRKCTKAAPQEAALSVQSSGGAAQRWMVVRSCKGETHWMQKPMMETEEPPGVRLFAEPWPVLQDQRLVLQGLRQRQTLLTWCPPSHCPVTWVLNPILLGRVPRVQQVTVWLPGRTGPIQVHLEVTSAVWPMSAQPVT